VHDLKADAAAIGLLERLDDGAERRAVGELERSGVDHPVQVGIGETVGGEREFDRPRAGAAERVQARRQVPGLAVVVDQVVHSRLEPGRIGGRKGRAGDRLCPGRCEVKSMEERGQIGRHRPGSARNRWYSASRNSAFQPLIDGAMARGDVVKTRPRLTHPEP
jgi:hypothetical protein